MRYFRILARYVICKGIHLNTIRFHESQLLNKLLFSLNYLSALNLTNHSTTAKDVDPVHNFNNVDEREYFQNVMKNNPDYKEQESLDDLLAENRLSTNKLVMIVRNLKINARMPEKTFSNEFDFLHKDFLESSFTVNDIIEILIRLPLNAVRRKQAKQLQKLLKIKTVEIQDKETKVDKLLLVAHLLRNLNYLKYGSFTLLRYLFGQQIHFTKSQILRYYYTLHFFSTIPVYEHMEFHVGMALSKRLESMTIDEMAIIVYALFRCKISPPYIFYETVARKFLEGLENVNALQAIILSKFLLLNTDQRARVIISQIFEKFTPLISNFPVLPATHIACLGIRVKVVNKDLIKQIMKRILIEPKSLELKDYSRLMLASVIANIDLRVENDFVKTVTEQLKQRAKENVLDPFSYISILSRFALYGIYLDEEYSIAFSQNFTDQIITMSSDALHQMLYLDVALELERPDYEGRLSISKRDKMVKAYFHQSDGSYDTVASKYGYEIADYLIAAYGADCCVVKHVLPYDNRFLAVLCVNKNNEAQQIGDALGTDCTGKVVRPPKDGNLWICFVFIRPTDCLWDKTNMNLLTIAKMKHFRLAGYHPLTIILNRWSKKSQEDKKVFLLHIIEKEIQKFKQR